MFSARDATTLRTVKNVKARDAGGVLRQCQFAKVRASDGALRTVWAYLTASASVSSVEGYGNSITSIGITTASVTATPTGGTAPYTYAWTRTDGGADAWTITTPTAATTSFRATAVLPSDNQTATFICTVTDANGRTAATSAVSASSTNTNTS